MEKLMEYIPTIIAAVFSVGGVGAYLTYRMNKPKTDAETKKINAEVVVTFAEGWKSYSSKLEERLGNAETKAQISEERADAAEKKARELEELVEKRDQEHKRIIEEKDKVITELTGRVGILEDELEKYKAKDALPS